MSNVIDKRYDFVFLFDCQDGNPNGDPDFDNTPRFDLESRHGLVSDVCLKRKVRNYVGEAKQGEAGYGIYVTAGVTLESQQGRAYVDLKMKSDPKDRGQIERGREWMCANFFDVRAFGAVMSTKESNCGQVRGPVQLTFSRSADPVLPAEHSITRVTYTKESEKASKQGDTQFGRKYTVPYALYRAHGFINPMFARQTGFHDGDLQLLWKALCNLFDLDRSAARGLMSARGLYVFEHASALGEAPAQKLFERVKAAKKAGVEAPRSFEDYEVTVRDAALPEGVKLLDLCTAAYA